MHAHNAVKLYSQHSAEEAAVHTGKKAVTVWMHGCVWLSRLCEQILLHASCLMLKTNTGHWREHRRHPTLTCLVRCNSLSYSFLVCSLLPSLISKSMYDCRHQGNAWHAHAVKPSVMPRCFACTAPCIEALSARQTARCHMHPRDEATTTHLPEDLRHVKDGLCNGQLEYGTRPVNFSKVLLLKLSKLAPGCAVGGAPFQVLLVQSSHSLNVPQLSLNLHCTSCCQERQTYAVRCSRHEHLHPEGCIIAAWGFASVIWESRSACRCLRLPSGLGSLGPAPHS